MPVTIKVRKHNANPIRENSVSRSSHDLLTAIAHRNRDEIGDIIQTSLPDSQLQSRTIYPQDHGLLRAAYEAYSYHHHLVLRPEDIWFAILTQFSFYVNAHSEELRSSFVSHEGKKDLILCDPGQDDMSMFCRNMTKLIEANVVDPGLRDWILPSFSTTTADDEAVAAVIMMGTLQRYFEYIFDAFGCGIPSVTMLGDKKDWQDIAKRIEKLAEYGEEPAQFSAHLKPVLREMVACFDAVVDDPIAADFWDCMVDYEGGSGKSYLSGWFALFAFWDEDGKRLAEDGDPIEPSRLRNGPGGNQEEIPERLKDIVGMIVELDSIPSGFVSVPVIYIDTDSVKIDAKLLAGFCGSEAITTSDASSERNLPLDTIRPVTAWWMYEVKGGKGKEHVDRSAFYEARLANDEQGGASTGYVSCDGKTVTVEEGLPRNF